MGRQFAYSSLQKPMTAVSQIVDSVARTHLTETTQFMNQPGQAHFGSPRWHLEQMASGAGAAVPYLASMAIVRPLMKAAVNDAVFRAAVGTAAVKVGIYRNAEAAAAGFVNGALFETSDSDQNLLISRLKQGTVSSVTMGNMHFLSRRFSTVLGPSNSSFGWLQTAATTGIAGAASGAIGYAADSVINDKTFSIEDLYKNVYSTTFTGVTLGLAGGEFLKLQNRKSTLPIVEEHVADGRMKGNAFDDSIKQSTGTSIVDRASDYYKLVSDKMSKVFLRTGDATEDKDKVNPLIDAKQDAPFLTRLSAVERTELIAKLERQADSKLLTEHGLTQLMTELKTATDHWKSDNLRDTEKRSAAAQEVFWEKSNSLNKVEVDESHRLARAARTDPGAWASGIGGIEEVIKARVERDAALAETKNFEERVDGLRAARMASLKTGIDNFLADKNLPSVELSAENLIQQRANYGAGRLTIGSSFINSGQLNATQVGLLAHEMVHLEQDTLRIRYLADRAGIKTVDEDAVRQLRDLERASGLDHMNPDVPDEVRPSENFIRNILLIRNGEELSAADSQKAQQILKAFMSYKAPWADDQQRLDGQFSRYPQKSEALGESRQDWILSSLLANPEAFKNTYGFDRIPKALVEIAEARKAPSLPGLILSGQSFAPEVYEAPDTIQQVEKIMSRNREKIERQLHSYAKKSHKWYFNNGLERQAHPAGVLAYLLAEAQGL